MLRVENSCEVGDLINEIAEKTGKTTEEVFKAFFKCGIYPEGGKTYLTDQFGGYDTDEEWLDNALEVVLTECSAKSIYVTEAI